MANTRDPAPWILGLNIGHHDASAALVHGGDLVAMAEEERFTRVKRALGQSPVNAAAFCLRHAGITLEEVVAVGLGSDMDLVRKWRALTKEELAREVRLEDPERLFPVEVFGAARRPPIEAVRHHVAHAMSAFWVSGFSSAATLVVDNRGESTSTTLFSAGPSGVTPLAEYGVEKSLGIYYRTAAQYTGLYKHFGEVGKLMGLAGYGRPTEPVPVAWENDDIVLRTPSISAERGEAVPPTLTAHLTAFFEENCFPYASSLSEEVMSYANFAASVQASLEEVVLGLSRRLRMLDGGPNLAVAGGVALNCTANGRLVDEAVFPKIYFQPVAHDAGVALGAAFEVARRLGSSLEPGTSTMNHAFWGPEYEDDEIERALSAQSLSARRFDEDEFVARVAAALADGKIVGWFQGRAEIGPRALGARSILATPRYRQSLVRLNRIKGREMWRPIAPSVTVEDFGRFFTSSHASPFMIVATRVRPEVRRVIPAVVHVDGTARPQAVARSAHPRYWKLLRAFERAGGVPVLANTSFNLGAEPIVNTPGEAIEDFLNTELDVLAIGDYFVEKPL